MLNKSGIKPIAETVLVLPDPVADKTASGIYVGTESDIERQQMAQTDGVIVAIATKAEVDAKVGDRVIFAKFQGMVRKGIDGKTYRLVNDTDVKAILEKEEKNG